VTFLALAGAMDRWRVVLVELGERPPLVGGGLPVFYMINTHLPGCILKKKINALALSGGTESILHL
jgi:hypothetical protein